VLSFSAFLLLHPLLCDLVDHEAQYDLNHKHKQLCHGQCRAHAAAKYVGIAGFVHTKTLTNLR